MPAYYRAGQFPAWGHLLAERRRRRWEWRLLPFVASAAIRPPHVNGCLSKSREPERRTQLPRQGLQFGAWLPGEVEIHPDSVAWSALRSFLVRGWSSHFPRSLYSFSLNSRLNWFGVARRLLLDSRRITSSV